jgi:hypothetical protein
MLENQPTRKLDLWNYSGNVKEDTEPLRSGCPKMHHIEKEKRVDGNCNFCVRIRTGDEGRLSEWRACVL